MNAKCPTTYTRGYDGLKMEKGASTLCLILNGEEGTHRPTSIALVSSTSDGRGAHEQNDRPATAHARILRRPKDRGRLEHAQEEVLMTPVVLHRAFFGSFKPCLWGLEEGRSLSAAQGRSRSSVDPRSPTIRYRSGQASGAHLGPA